MLIHQLHSQIAILGKLYFKNILQIFTNSLFFQANFSQQNIQLNPQTRLLQQTSLQSDNKQSTKLTNDQFLLTLVLIVGGFGLLILIFCLICCIKNIIGRRMFFGGNRMIVANVSINYEIIFPSLDFKIFEREFDCEGVQECVICLMEFVTVKSKNMSEEIVEVKEEREQISEINFNNTIVVADEQRTFQIAKMQEPEPGRIYSPQTKQPTIDRTLPTLNKNPSNQFSKSETLKQPQFIKLTICNHLLHAQCLDNWLQRQNNCPLCRQSFDQQSISEWEAKLNIDFSALYKEYNEKKRKKNHLSRIRHENNETMIQLGRNNEMIDENIFVSRPFETQKFQNIAPIIRIQEQQQQYSIDDEYAIAVYQKIKSYHKNSRNNKNDNPTLSSFPHKKQNIHSQSIALSNQQKLPKNKEQSLKKLQFRENLHENIFEADL